MPPSNARRIRLVTPLVAVMWLATWPSRPAAAPQADPRFDQLAELADRKMVEYHVPGVALGVMKDGQTLTRGLGVTNVDDARPVTPDTLFPLASISKTVTSTALVELASQGKVDLDAPVRRYLPDFRVADDTASRTVTIRNLLTHTPGWEGQLTVPDHGSDTLADFVRSLVAVPQLAPPGAVWSYNNAGFAVAGRVIEVVTGESFDRAVRDLVFQPAGLSSATTVLGDVVTHRFAVGHRDRNGVAEVVRPFVLSTNPPAGGVAMSVVDLLAYAKFQLDTPALAVMRTPQLRKNATDDDMGIGWQLRTVGGVLTAAHGGTAAGGLCLLVELVPERRLAFAILTNDTNGWRLIQDVERAALESYEHLALAPNQAIAHRGVDEVMTHATALATQPDLTPYVGTYSRAPLGSMTVRVDGSTLRIGGAAVGGGTGRPIAFYGKDRAFFVDGGTPGQPVEFIRKPDGTIGWIRVDGRIGRREPS